MSTSLLILILSNDFYYSYCGGRQVFDASGNKLTGLSQSSFKHSECLEELLLGGNWITTIHPRTFLPLTTLRRLDLSNNYLEELSIAPLEPLERKIEWLRLDGNPWRCGCRLSQLWTWLQDHLSVVPDLRGLTCHIPKVITASLLSIFLSTRSITVAYSSVMMD